MRRRANPWLRGAAWLALVLPGGSACAGAQNGPVPPPPATSPSTVVPQTPNPPPATAPVTVVPQTQPEAQTPPVSPSSEAAAAEREAATPAWMKRLPPRVLVWTPPAALVLSFLSFAMAAAVLLFAARQRRKLLLEYTEARPRLQEMRRRFEAWERATKAGTVSSNPSTPSPAVSGQPGAAEERKPKRKRSPAHLPRPVDQSSSTAPATESDILQGREAAPDQVFPHPPASESLTSESLTSESSAPDPGKASDPVADYARARELSPDGADYLRERYGPLTGLSCTNLDEARATAGVPLRFRESARPTFLAFAAAGVLWVVPMPDRDLGAMRQSLEGVFRFPPEPAGTPVLCRAATVRQAGAEWLLQTPGEIGFA